jgi:tight adherence protein C
VTEATLAQGLAAAAAACAASGAVTAARRMRVPSVGPRARRAASVAFLVLVGTTVVPGPRIVTVPAIVVLGVQLRRIARSRRLASDRRAMDAEVPQLLDLLAAGSTAGLSAVAGLERAVSALRGPLGRELRTTLDSVELGARWRDELAAVADRLALPDLRRAISVLTRTETLGTSLIDATRDLAADVRHARRAAVAERARAAPVKMLFPLVFLILPAFLLLTVVPVLLTTVRSIH